MWTDISYSLFVPIFVLSSSIYFELWQFSDFQCRHFFNSRWRPDTISIVIGTKFHMKVNTTKYMWANCRAFVIHIFWDMPDYRHSGRPFYNSRWRPGIMSIPISYESIYCKVYVCQFWFTCCKYILTYARLYINGDHFLIQDGGRLPCR